jgi:hypothetical protein
LVYECEPNFTPVNPKNQAPFEDGLQILDQLRRRRMTITALAAQIKRPRPTVSKAISTGRFPGVLRQIKGVLRG